MRRCVCLSLFLLFLIPVSASSQQDNFLKRLQGDWEGEGTAMGGASHLRIKWEWVLDNKFLRLSLKSDMTLANGAPEGRSKDRRTIAPTVSINTSRIGSTRGV